MRQRQFGKSWSARCGPAAAGMLFLAVLAACGQGNAANAPAADIPAAPAAVTRTPAPAATPRAAATQAGQTETSFLLAPSPSDPLRQVIDVDIYGPFGGPVGNSRAFTAVINGLDANKVPRDLIYTWDFGDGATANGINVTHTYASAGKFNLKLSIASRETPEVQDTDTRVLTITTE